MPKFVIVEILREEREVEADSAQDALDLWLIHGETPGVGPASADVKERWVEDANGKVCEVEDA